MPSVYQSVRIPPEEIAHVSSSFPRGLFAHHRLIRFVRLRPEIRIAHQNAGASVPAQDGVVVAGRTQLDSLLIALHGLDERVERGEGGSGRGLADLRVAGTLPDNPGI